MNHDDLSPVERELVERAAAGTTCHVAWRPADERRVRAAVIYELCVGTRWPVHAKGVALQGAIIDEPLDFDHATLRAPLKLYFCQLRRGVSFNSATLPELVLSGSELTRPLRMQRAKVTDYLNLSGATLNGSDAGGNALIGDGLHAGSALLRHRFKAAGAIRLPDASIDGQLDMSGAKVTGTDTDGAAVVANRLHVGSDAFLRETFEAAGALNLIGTTIKGQLSMRAARLRGTDSKGNALIAEGLHADNAVLGERFEAAGAIRLLYASIDGQLNMHGATITGTDTDGNALIGNGLRAGFLGLGKGFVAAGAISLCRPRGRAWAWFSRHWLPIATGAVGFGIGCVVGWARVGDGSVAWGTFGEWVGGLGAAVAVLWAVWAFRQEREANERRLAEAVMVSKQWIQLEVEGAALTRVVRAHLLVMNSGPAPIDQVVVSGEYRGAPAWGAWWGDGSHRLRSDWERGVLLTWPWVSPEQPDLWWDEPEEPDLADLTGVTVFFQDATAKRWSRAIDEPPKRLRGLPSEALTALADARATGQ